MDAGYKHAGMTIVSILDARYERTGMTSILYRQSSASQRR